MTSHQLSSRTIDFRNSSDAAAAGLKYLKNDGHEKLVDQFWKKTKMGHAQLIPKWSELGLDFPRGESGETFDHPKMSDEMRPIMHNGIDLKNVKNLANGYIWSDIVGQLWQNFQCL